jgi:(R,R)-butanediol dehydrogenase / meso-butanediol dehydrogenase / diacetyl reductase
VATVVDAGPAVRNLEVGNRVVIDPNVTCGVCDQCRRGMSNVCSNMTTLGIFRNGGLAEYSLAPVRALHRIDPAVPPDRATLAEPLSCVIHSFERSAFTIGESVAILGAGPIGLLFLMMFKAAGARQVVMTEPVAFRRRMAQDLGADLVIDPKMQDAATEVTSASGGGVDVVVDATGTLLPESVEMVRSGGRVVLFGMNQHGAREVNQYAITRKELTIVGTFIQRTAFPKAVRLLESGLLPVEKLITHRLRLCDVGEALDAMRLGEAVKAVVSPHGEA